MPRKADAENSKREHSNSLPRPPAGLFAQMSLFALNFIKHPSMVGGILPSSRFLVREILKQVDWDEARVIVEYGPGLGTITGAALQRMRPDAKLIALEINPDFIRYLNATISDPRFVLMNESAADVERVLQRLGMNHADCVISGIPFSQLTHPMRDTIVRKTHAILRPRGNFLVYQLSAAVLPYLESVFGTVARDFELLNVFPMRIFYCAR